ncbi:MAG TPA: acetate--CoA ligase family protein [Candidatus Dormibacteraeota bacterium]|nr:acetate--CoA ligase family protein [Candidatus Dormibacteraeota bacterium]
MAPRPPSPNAQSVESPRSPVDWETLDAYGIAHPRLAVCADLAAALEFWRSSPAGWVCLKGTSSGHKTRQGLVALNLESEGELTEAWVRLSAVLEELALGPTLLVQEQVPPGRELILGGRRDPVFGPAVLLGLGGTLAEVLNQGQARLAPVTKAEAERMAAQMLGANDPAVSQLVLAVSQLLLDHGEIEELDLNPVIMTKSGPVAVDLRVIAAGAGTKQAVTAGEEVRREAGLAIGRMLAPTSVALIGASTDVDKPGGRVLHYLTERGLADRVHLVNSRTPQIGDLPTVAAVAELPLGVDVAVIATTAEAVAGILGECADRGIGSAIVFASGFSEAGHQELENEIRRIARTRGIRVCGVNTIGVVGDLPLTFTRALDYPEPCAGSVSYVTQSGALGGSLLIRSWAHRLGTAQFVCVGNQTDLTIPDYLRFLAQDPATRTVGLFVEGLEDGRDFAQAARAVTNAGKGLAVLRSGETAAGSAAARSHTGALAGLSQLYDQVIADSGAVRVADLTELVAVCEALDWQPRASGRRLGILATSGAACSLLADGALGQGLTLPPWSEATTAALRAALPSFAAVGNPIDTTGNVLRDPQLVGRALECVAAAPEVDVILIALSTLIGEASRQAARDIVQATYQSGKPVVVGWSLPESVCPEAFRRLREARIPVFDSYSLALLAATSLTRMAVRGA